jgi:hypothetical protein
VLRCVAGPVGIVKQQSSGGYLPCCLPSGSDLSLSCCAQVDAHQGVAMSLLFGLGCVTKSQTIMQANCVCISACSDSSSSSNASAGRFFVRCLPVFRQFVDLPPPIEDTNCCCCAVQGSPTCVGSNRFKPGALTMLLLACVHPVAGMWAFLLRSLWA